MLGVDIEGRLEPPADWQRYYGQTFEKEYALISPFSRSCSRHSGEIPNKTLDDWKWEPVIRYLRRHGHTVKVVGTPKDRLKNNSIPESDYISASNLAELELILKKSSIMISVDNGLAHMASALNVKLLLLWPQVSCVEFICPAWSPQTAVLQIGDPNKVIPAQLLVGIRRMYAFLERGENDSPQPSNEGTQEQENSQSAETS